MKGKQMLSYRATNFVYQEVATLGEAFNSFSQKFDKGQAFSTQAKELDQVARNLVNNEWALKDNTYSLSHEAGYLVAAEHSLLDAAHTLQVQRKEVPENLRSDFDLLRMQTRLTTKMVRSHILNITRSRHG